MSDNPEKKSAEVEIVGSEVFGAKAKELQADNKFNKPGEASKQGHHQELQQPGGKQYKMKKAEDS